MQGSLGQLLLSMSVVFKSKYSRSRDMTHLSTKGCGFEGCPLVGGKHFAAKCLAKNTYAPQSLDNSSCCCTLTMTSVFILFLNNLA